VVPQAAVHRAAVPRALDAQPAAPREPTRLTLSVRTAAEAAGGALRDAVGALAGALDGAPASWSADEPRDSDRWADEGGPRAPTVAEYAVAGSDAADDRFRRGRTRGAHDASPSARDVAYAALGAYARALRHDGTPFAAALAILGTAVDDAAEVEAAGLLQPAVLAAVQRDAAQCCRAAFAAP
jgi:hypothetical protein